MALGLGRLRLETKTFWALSIPELIAMLGGPGQGSGGVPMRNELERMMALWPDRIANEQ